MNTLDRCTWCASSPRTPPADGDSVEDPAGDGSRDPATHEPDEQTFVDEDTFWATF